MTAGSTLTGPARHCDRWVILTIRLAHHGGIITAVDGLTGAAAEAGTVPEALARLGEAIGARWQEMQDTGDRWPHEKRTRERLARFYAP